MSCLLIILQVKIASLTQNIAGVKSTVRLAGAQVGLSIAADCGSEVRSFGPWAAANCAALPTADAAQ